MVTNKGGGLGSILGKLLEKNKTPDYIKITHPIGDFLC
jgi:hypothetical protein